VSVRHIIQIYCVFAD